MKAFCGERPRAPCSLSLIKNELHVTDYIFCWGVVVAKGVGGGDGGGN